MALNAKGRTSAETRERVTRIARELGYRPNVRAQRLRGGTSRTIALFNPVQSASALDERFEFALQLAMPFAQAALNRDYSLLLIPPTVKVEQLSQFDIDGVVVMDPIEEDPYCAAFRANGVTVVTIGQAPRTPVDGFVDRHSTGAVQMLDHLASEGARRIAVILAEERVASSVAVGDYLERWSAASGRDIVVEFASVGAGQQGGYDIARRLLSAERPPDAIYTPFSPFAVGVLAAAHELEIRVPFDLKVAANFDGQQTATANPPLTALDLDLPGLAAAASGLLIDLLGGGVARSAVVPAPRVIARASTVAG